MIRKYNRDNNLDMDIVLGKDHNDSMLLVDTGRALAFAMDDILLFGLKANATNPAEWDVVAMRCRSSPMPACCARTTRSSRRWSMA